MAKYDFRYIDCIADIHGMHQECFLNGIKRPELKLEGGYMLIVAGDLTGNNKPHNYETFNEWIGKQKYDHKIVIAGNHDGLLDRPWVDKSILLSNCIYLCNSGLEIDGLRIWGSPYTPKFRDWFFGATQDTLRDMWAQIPPNTDILVTHGPPSGILSKNVVGECCGCPELLGRIKQIRPRYHVYGHIHEGYGVEKHGETTHINCSHCDEYYSPINQPIRIMLNG